MQQDHTNHTHLAVHVAGSGSASLGNGCPNWVLYWPPGLLTLTCSFIQQACKGGVLGRELEELLVSTRQYFPISDQWSWLTVTYTPTHSSKPPSRPKHRVILHIRRDFLIVKSQAPKCMRKCLPVLVERNMYERGQFTREILFDLMMM